MDERFLLYVVQDRGNEQWVQGMFYAPQTMCRDDPWFDSMLELCLLEMVSRFDRTRGPPDGVVLNDFGRVISFVLCTTEHVS